MNHHNSSVLFIWIHSIPKTWEGDNKPRKNLIFFKISPFSRNLDILLHQPGEGNFLSVIIILWIIYLKKINNYMIKAPHNPGLFIFCATKFPSYLLHKVNQNFLPKNYKIYFNNKYGVNSSLFGWGSFCGSWYII